MRVQLTVSLPIEQAIALDELCKIAGVPRSTLLQRWVKDAIEAEHEKNRKLAENK